jgi:hypothetical protein
MLKLLNLLIGLEPLNESIYTMMMDVTPWLTLHDGQMLLDSRAKNDAFSDAEYFIMSWEDVLEMPFVTPSPQETNYLISVLVNMRSRSDLYSILLDALDLFMGRIVWIRDQADARKSAGSLSLQDDPGLRAMKKKLEWLMRFMYSKYSKID